MFKTIRKALGMIDHATDTVDTFCADCQLHEARIQPVVIGTGKVALQDGGA